MQEIYWNENFQHLNMGSVPSPHSYLSSQKLHSNTYLILVINYFLTEQYLGLNNASY